MNFKLKEDGSLFGSEAKSAQVFKADIPPVSVDVNCMNVVEDLKSQADITPVSEANSDNVNDADQVYEIQNIKTFNVFLIHMEFQFIRVKLDLKKRVMLMMCTHQ